MNEPSPIYPRVQRDVTDKDIATQAVHAGVIPDAATGAIMTPVIQSATYVQDELGQRYDYARTNHPTREALEESIRTLEGGKYGHVFSSGMAASDMVCRLLRPGDEVIASPDMYGGMYRLFENVYRPMGVRIHYVPMQDIQAVESYFSTATRLLWLETPSNPMLELVDIEQISHVARKYGSLTVVDNTFATPYLQQPFSLGADVVVHSLTKYMNGHSDVLMGAVCCNNDTLNTHFSTMQRNIGAVPGPWDCFLVMRGIKTLHLRMRAHCAHAVQVAAFLKKHAAVEHVYYPGFDTHAGHDIAVKQMKRGFGGIVSFTLKGAKEADVVAFLKRLCIFSLAESLGGVESLASYPARMTHASIPEHERVKRGITQDLVRLSVGVEEPNDLIADLEQALAVK